ncbi:MAG TPA: caspase family protein [Thermoanaerobaculia bacterium]|nr:caspase family protein [Thermoanaerobaculia bacterium]
MDRGGATRPHATRRALLIGIDDYTASRLPKAKATAPQRDWPNLKGGVNDVEAMKEMLVLLYGFDARDIVTLVDQHATRAAILGNIERHLVARAAAGDTLLFYYAGHGSQVANSKSAEPDKLDESIVPADSRAGAADIRDKELRRIFNRILDRGARLSVILDACHSGSGARGLATGARPRGVSVDTRDVADGSDGGPAPEERGALVVAATQDFDPAWETRDDRGRFHGAFSWAWLRAMRDSAPGESATETFLRAHARLRGETPYQEPVLAGNESARRRPFLGARSDRRGDRAVVAIRSVRSDGTVVLQGGWANGLAVGSELRLLGATSAPVRLKITAMTGLGQSEARIVTGHRMTSQAVRSGALLEVIGWAAPPARPLRVWMPRIANNAPQIAAIGRALSKAAARKGIRWVRDPIDVTPTHLLRRSPAGWELLGARTVVQLGADATAAIAKIPAGSSLFVQLPAPSSLIGTMAVGPRSEHEGVAPVGRAEEADYVLAGRFTGGTLSYAWVRPSVRGTDRRKSGLPLRTQWMAADTATATSFQNSVLQLRKIHAWHQLESPAESRAPYRLALRRQRDDALVQSEVTGETRYALALRTASAAPPPRAQQRYYYAFVIDSHGKGILLFPQFGSVENRFPLSTAAPPPAEIALAPAGTFEVEPPYGVDTYFLLSTDEPLPNPAILDWDGVRGTRQSASPLEELLLLTASGRRSVRVVTPATWSLERVVIESVPPPRARSR